METPLHWVHRSRLKIIMNENKVLFLIFFSIIPTVKVLLINLKEKHLQVFYFYFLRDGLDKMDKPGGIPEAEVLSFIKIQVDLARDRGKRGLQRGSRGKQRALIKDIRWPE